MNKIFFSAFCIYISAIATPPTEQKYPILKSSLANESVIKQVCLSNLDNYPDVCDDCNNIEKIFRLNRNAGFINTLLQINEEKKTTSLFSFSAKMIYKKKTVNQALAVESQCNVLFQEYNESISRILSIVDSNDPYTLGQHENILLVEGLTNAATNKTVNDYNSL